MADVCLPLANGLQCDQIIISEDDDDDGGGDGCQPKTIPHQAKLWMTDPSVSKSLPKIIKLSLSLRPFSSVCQENDKNLPFAS